MPQQRGGPRLPPIRGGDELWRRAKNAVTSIQFLRKSGRETWRAILPDEDGDDDAWKLPVFLFFWTSGVWIKRKVSLLSGRLIAVAPGDASQMHSKSSNERELCDLRDVRQVILASSAAQVSIDGEPEIIFPWTLVFENSMSVLIAAAVPRDRLLWASAVQKLSGAALRGDYGDFQNPSSVRRIGSDFDSTDMGLAADLLPLASHAALSYLDKSHYAGGYANGCWEGTGRLKMSTGDIYEGRFQQGVRHGKGLMNYASGDLYRGDFVWGRRDGKGVMYLHDRRKAKGRLLSGLSAPHLQLAWQFPRALKAMDPHHDAMERYEGAWKDDERHGSGVLTENAHAEPVKYHVEYEKGKLMVKQKLAASEFLPRELAYKDGEMMIIANVAVETNTCVVHGEGPFFFSIDPPLPASLSLHPRTGAISGIAKAPLKEMAFTVTCHNKVSQAEGLPATASILISVREDEVSSGWRRKEYADGSIYTGNFEDGLWHGRGSLRLPSAETCYRGSWYKGLRHGHGDQVIGRSRYAGEFAQNARSGYGRMHYGNGDSYVGEWRDDCRHGVGELTHSDGRVSSGRWERDVLVREMAEKVLPKDGLAASARRDQRRGQAPEGHRNVTVVGEESDANDKALLGSLAEDLDMERARSSMKVTVPVGMRGGQTLKVATANGCTMQVTIPDGLEENDTFEMFIASCLRQSKEDWQAALQPSRAAL